MIQMARRESTAGVAEIDRPEGAIPSRPKLIIPLGRGNTGKTVLLRWLAERAAQNGRDLKLADGDPTNATLAEYFPNTVRPPSTNQQDRRDWFEALLEKQIEEGGSMAVDFGGGDLILKRQAAELELTDFLDSSGIEVVALHLIGPNLDDLAYLGEVERDQLFAPKATVLVINEGLVPLGRSERTAFEPIVSHPIFTAAIGRGAKWVRMPRLACVQEVENRRISFIQAEMAETGRGLPALGVINRQRVALWRKEMETEFEAVSDWLP